MTTNYSSCFQTHWAIKNCLQLWGTIRCCKGSLHNLLLRDFKRKWYYYFFRDSSDVSYLDEGKTSVLFQSPSLLRKPRCLYSGSTNCIMKRSVLVIFRFFFFLCSKVSTTGKLDYLHCSHILESSTYIHFSSCLFHISALWNVTYSSRCSSVS